MKLYKVDFEPMWPVPHGLIILAKDYAELEGIIAKTITHTEHIYEITEIDITKSGVVFYESGNY